MSFGRIRLLYLAAVGAIVAFGVVPGNAMPITYEFTATAVDGSLAGTQSTGSLSFDSASLLPPPGGLNRAVGLLTALDFTWNGHHYTEVSANTGWIETDTHGVLSRLVFGTTCNEWGCVAQVSTTDNWFLQIAASGGELVYYTEGDTTLRFAEVDARQVSPPIPEPSVSMLVVLAIGTLARRRMSGRDL